jgi:RNA polymerase sigma factor (sigma-70 family)
VVTDVGELYTSLAEYLRRIVGSRVSAPPVVIDDACQFAWARLIVHLRRVDDEAVMSWLVTTAIREAIKVARRDQRELSLEARVDENGELNVASPAPGPHEQAEWQEQLELVRKLPSRQQRFLWLFAAGDSYEEISDQEAGLTKRAVERQIHRGRRTLGAAA